MAIADTYPSLSGSRTSLVFPVFGPAGVLNFRWYPSGFPTFWGVPISHFWYYWLSPACLAWFSGSGSFQDFLLRRSRWSATLRARGWDP